MSEYKFRQSINPEALLLLLYCVIFFLASISQLNDSEFWNYDPRSIMSALDGLTSSPLYNMNSQYHSQYYGWTFFSINFVAISLLKLSGLASEMAINSVVKTIHFITGGLVVMVSYRLSNRFLPSIVSALTVFLFMIDPTFTYYVMTLHPEMMGLLFQLLGIKFLCVVWNKNKFEWSQFTVAMAMLCLSALCKQPFAICSFFILLGFILASVRNEDRRIAIKKSIVIIASVSLLIAIATLFVIHPFALLEPSRFIKAQRDLLGSQASPFSASLAFDWFIMTLRTLTVPLNVVILVSVLQSRETPYPFKLSVTFTVLCALIFVLGQRVLVSWTYFFPAYGFIYFNIAYYICWLNKKHSTSNTGMRRKLSSSALAVIIGLVGVSNLAYTTTTVHAGYLLDNRSTLNRAWDHLASLPSGTRVAFSPDIAILDPLKGTSCSAWAGCGTVRELEAFDPEVVVFSPNSYYDYAAYMEFVASHHFDLVNQISSDSRNRPKCSTAANVLVMQNPLSLVPALYQAYVGTILDCLREYSAALSSHSTGSISTGPDVFIYQKASNH